MKVPPNLGKSLRAIGIIGSHHPGKSTQAKPDPHCQPRFGELSKYPGELLTPDESSLIGGEWLHGKYAAAPQPLSIMNHIATCERFPAGHLHEIPDSNPTSTGNQTGESGDLGTHAATIVDEVHACCQHPISLRFPISNRSPNLLHRCIQYEFKFKFYFAPSELLGPQERSLLLPILTSREYRERF